MQTSKDARNAIREVTPGLTLDLSRQGITIVGQEI
jgi:hypothetical protein